MNNLAEVLEQELEDAVEVKNKKSLHRYIMLLADNIVTRSVYDQKITDMSHDIKLLAETMKLGFEAVDKRFEDMNRRFEDMNKRFEDLNKRFSMMFSFMNIGFGIIILITILFKFLQF